MARHRSAVSCFQNNTPWLINFLENPSLSSLAWGESDERSHGAAAKTLQDNIRNVPAGSSAISSEHTSHLRAVKTLITLMRLWLTHTLHFCFPQERPKPKIPILHFRNASPPFIVCVKLVSVCVCVSDLNLTFLAHRKWLFSDSARVQMTVRLVSISIIMCVSR